MKIKTFVFNPIGENTYLAIDEPSLECVLIDAGCLSDQEKNELVQYVKQHNLKLKYLLNTHLHLDHCFGNIFIEQQFGLKTKAHKKDEKLLLTIESHSRNFGINYHDGIPEVGEFIEEGKTIEFGASTLKALHVPGHSEGSLVYYAEKDELLFSGDVLFQGSIGRTDLPGGNYAQLIEGIQKKLLTLKDNTVVYPGHGPSTSIGDERQTNPFL